MCHQLGNHADCFTQCSHAASGLSIQCLLSPTELQQMFSNVVHHQLQDYVKKIGRNTQHYCNHIYREISRTSPGHDATQGCMEELI